ncbi:bifunctional TH2 protein, mitochondrial-like [Ipomoea triloba]|uniref:bifunctional TH2 protein, mitochondrial-like n=1 Tax=Ipomoea triloba TaxID=35885 RepID=UPI00125E36D5|nr:bifunctional TH2 protein, mitochondrial-like [Ipomoea triloba]XP_031092312.1 bifunctional TH2 protein, mitochondrial-like [Ipomoea triloba]XP_031092313.1 bifunctional TH2 protein, mitochondrial-like [Ipomoea triloba]XP_031092314.1 bifunctional TH2 protein, mitochondrial-like [Ipomoea triloba]XP_031092316.1 bifunctional TH2 protein, mitochondrial-like [Ipomoea triloba]
MLMYTGKHPRNVYGRIHIAEDCWQKFCKESAFALYTPFIVSLASGNLKVESFRKFVAQDVCLLKIFANAFELAETNAQDDYAKHQINELRKTAINLHDSFVQEWGSYFVKDTTLNPATSKCQDFLLATASGKIDGVTAPIERTKLPAYTLGAIASFMKLYAYIGKELKGLTDHNCYKKWIENYSSDRFQDLSFQTEYLLNRLSDSFTAEELDIIETLYSQGFKHEIDFFLAQPLIQKAVVPLSGEHNLEERQLMIFSEFNFSFASVDSYVFFAEMAIAKESDKVRKEYTYTYPYEPTLKTICWREAHKNYINAYVKCIEDILATEKAENLNHKGLRKALEKVSYIEKEANLSVIKFGGLKGLKLKDIILAGERSILHDVCFEFFQTVKKKESLNADVHVLSYCWCGDLIRSTLSAGGLNGIKVHANELEFEESVCTGQILRKVESPIDKVEAFAKILESCGKGNDKKELLTVYIGDSFKDLLCLLEADIGIMVYPSPNLIDLAEHFGIRLIPLFHGVVDKQKKSVEGAETWKGGLSGILYTAISWVEIHAFLIGS